MSVIQEITGRVIRDSRGLDTVACAVTLASGVSAESSVPSGKSTGSHEAAVLPADGAVRKMGEVATLLQGKDSADQRSVDETLIEKGGQQKKELGGNTTLAVSIAIARAHAREAKIPLWEHLRSLSGITEFPRLFPRPFVNLINGGAHTGNTKLFQEYILVCERGSMKESLAYADEVRKRLGAQIETQYPGTPLGDEGGFALQIDDPLEPLSLIARYAGDGATFAIDAAATESAYLDDDRTEMYRRLFSEFPLQYLEDPYGEEQFDLFALLQAQFPDRAIIGDDLTTTSVSRMEKALKHRSVGGVILKPNQIGTVTEALAAAKLAREYGWQLIASHRSGETEDSFIADFAYGVGADGIKIGTSIQKERWAKYARLQEIEGEGSRAAAH